MIKRQIKETIDKAIDPTYSSTHYDSPARLPTAFEQDDLAHSNTK